MPQFFKKLEITFALPYYTKNGSNIYAEFDHVTYDPVSYTHLVTVPDDYTGDVMGDLNKRRGRVLGMNPVAGGSQEILAEDVYKRQDKYTNLK